MRERRRENKRREEASDSSGPWERSWKILEKQRGALGKNNVSFEK